MKINIKKVDKITRIKNLCAYYKRTSEDFICKAISLYDYLTSQYHNYKISIFSDMSENIPNIEFLISKDNEEYYYSIIDYNYDSK